MKIYETPFRTYQGARKRLVEERLRAKRESTWVWGVSKFGERWHVTRMSQAEFKRETAIQVALRALDLV